MDKETKDDTCDNCLTCDKCGGPIQELYDDYNGGTFKICFQPMCKYATGLRTERDHLLKAMDVALAASQEGFLFRYVDGKPYVYSQKSHAVQFMGRMIWPHTFWPIDIGIKE